jgi:hypothetical protein
VQAGEDTYASWWRDWGLVELIEAAARSGQPEAALPRGDHCRSAKEAATTPVPNPLTAGRRSSP